MSNKKEEKGPPKGRSLEELMKVEAGYYYIQIGDNLFESESGKLVFQKDRAEYFFAAVWQGLRDMKENGTKEEVEEANHCLLHFRIIPLRFH